MASCCEDKSCEITALREKHRRVLQIVLALNAAMFAVEGMSGWLAHSTSLLADALDMFGDATVYAMRASMCWHAASASRAWWRWSRARSCWRSGWG